MKLLICTQTVDKNDSYLGFFVRWLEEFAKHFEQVTVICLREGEHNLPPNVRVFPIGRGSRAVRAYRLIKSAARFRNNYDVVLVHMNPEYLIAAGWLWRLLGKKTALWYMHKSVDLKLRIAEKFADIIFSASKESFRLPTLKLQITGHGIDTDFFSPDPNEPRGDSLLSVGRLMKSKRHDLAIEIASREGKELCIAGEGPERQALESLAQRLGARVTFLGPLSHARLRNEYRRAGALIHTSETGSLDKVVLEALACGCPVRSSDPALAFLQSEGPEYVRTHHSLPNLIERIVRQLGSAPMEAAAFYRRLSSDTAHQYEESRWAKNPIARAHYAMHALIVRSLSSLVPQKGAYLEVGAGPGNWSAMLLQGKDVSVTLCDISPAMLQKARAILSNYQVQTEAGDFLQWDRRGRTFDFFFSSRAIEYFADADAACERIASALAPCARGAIITKHPHAFRSRLRGQGAMHGGQVSPRLLVAALQRHGLAVTSMRPVTMTFPLIHTSALAYLLFHTIGRLPLLFLNAWAAESYLVTFEKPC